MNRLNPIHDCRSSAGFRQHPAAGVCRVRTDPARLAIFQIPDGCLGTPCPTARRLRRENLQTLEILHFLWIILISTFASIPLGTAEASPPHWSFQPLASVKIPRPPPRAGDDKPGLNPIDLFIQRPLEAEKLVRAPQANRRALARRVALDLTGLPPSPEEIETYLDDTSPDATGRLIEHFLSSPTYGERWGRHWLDVARYADSNGQDENKAMSHAWRYRDYVVRAFNEDKPFDQFIIEQLAGDLLPVHESESRGFDAQIATGFLVLGPKMLAEQDKAKLVMDVVDEQIDTVSRAFLGLTISCARCHDHKFDPIPTEDYYALAGVLKSTRSMQNLDFVSQWSEVNITPAADMKRLEAHQALVKSAQKTLDSLVAKANSELTNKSGQKLPKEPRKDYPKETVQQLESLEKDRDALLGMGPPPAQFAMGVTEDKPVDLPVHIRGNHLTLAAFPVARGLPGSLATSEAPTLASKQSGRLQMAQWLASTQNPLAARVIVNRVWQGHFGTGLVKTSDNFGVRGDPPTHPELLDWLSLEFVRSGWSIKHLHRLILASATYQQGSSLDAQKAATSAALGQADRSVAASLERARIMDPDNRLLSYFPRQRHEAEMIRDSMLKVSGLLDSSMGGTLVGWKNADYVPREESAFKSHKRSLYLPVVRDRVFDVFTIFDFANPSVGVSLRAATTVPHQALFFLNSSLMKECAAGLARRAFKSHLESPESRVRWVYEVVYSRPPTRAEESQCLIFLRTPSGTHSPTDDSSKLPSRLPPQAAFETLCRTLLASNEFNHRE